MKEGVDGFKVTFYDREDMGSCSLVIEGFHRFFLCNEGKRLEIAEFEMYDMIKRVLDNYYFDNGEGNGT